MRVEQQRFFNPVFRIPALDASGWQRMVRSLEENSMNSLAKKTLILAVSATLVACAAQRDPERDSTANGSIATPPPPKLETPTYSPPVLEAIQEQIAADSSASQPLADYPSNAHVERRAAEQPLAKMALAPSVAIASPYPAPYYQPPTNTEKYQHLDDNPVHRASEQPVSTFSIDVDTGAYANVRRFLNAGQLPPEDAVRVEEMINYFDYEYAPPASRSTPFKVATELAPAPWNENALLLKIGIKGFEISARERPASNLVFLIDVSGSMQSADKLPLLKNAFRLLTDQLTAQDRVSIAVYAGSSGIVLEPTPGNQKHKIMSAINQLSAGGSTNGAEGIQLAYQLARQGFIEKGINRVILATDGDFNVGTVDFEALVDMAERERKSDVALTTIGFGTGNYNDQLMERLADAGNGNYAYIDSLSEARKVLVSELSSTLFTIAKDVKIQVEFNPTQVLEYRLIGYENRKLAREDFNNDKVDAGEIGAGHRVTALYEVVLAGNQGLIDPLRYGEKEKSAAVSDEIANVRLRYKQPDSDTSKLLEYPISRKAKVAFDKTSADFRFATSVAAFGQLLRGGKYVGSYSYDDVANLAKGALSDDNDGYRREFVSLVKLADSLKPSNERVGRIEE
jgi:Ca-activated chloride channel family protein